MEPTKFHALQVAEQAYHNALKKFGEDSKKLAGALIHSLLVDVGVPKESIRFETRESSIFGNEPKDLDRAVVWVKNGEYSLRVVLELISLSDSRSSVQSIDFLFKRVSENQILLESNIYPGQAIDPDGDVPREMKIYTELLVDALIEQKEKDRVTLSR